MTSHRIWAHFMLNGTIMIGTVEDMSNVYSLTKPILMMIQPMGQGQVNAQFADPFVPMQPPKNKKITVQPTAVMHSFEIDNENKQLMDKYREITSNIILPGAGLVSPQSPMMGGNY